ncbi:hypothetical protein LEP1GSC029_4740 [Leptospira interrogans str. 2002000626]|uniref:Gam-like protein n=1 Tax=Leptospira interrogans str. 2002000626 TaxID=996803 RepID=A0A829CWB4_LEPIR|nr:hypothetical protein LEP1GSC029_4740 [Leptospira interrogans str. 2002000626]
MEETLTSLRLEEQQKEEELLKFKSDLYETIPDGDLSDQVAQNKTNLEHLRVPKLEKYQSGKYTL